MHEPEVGTNILNVVFVHGFGGSATGTWTHSQTSLFWPSLLHEDGRFANARISTFGYDANLRNIFAEKDVLDVSEFAKQLLDCLDSHYDKYGDVRSIENARLILDSHDLCRPQSGRLGREEGAYLSFGRT